MSSSVGRLTGSRSMAQLINPFCMLGFAARVVRLPWRLMAINQSSTPNLTVKISMQKLQIFTAPTAYPVECG